MNSIQTINCINLSVLTNLCRICLTNSGKMFSIISDIVKDETMNPMYLRISEIFAAVTNCNVQQDDDLPKWICPACTFLLQQAYKFKVKFEHSNTVIRHILQNKSVQKSTINTDSDKNKIAVLYLIKNDHIFKTVEKTQNSKEQMHITEDKQSSTKEVKNVDENIQSLVKEMASSTKKVQSSFYENSSYYTETSYPCPICTNEYSPLKLREHVGTHIALKKYLTIRDRPSRNKKYYATAETRKKFITFHKKQEKLHKCVYCQDEFTADELGRHYLTHKKQNHFECDECGRAFTQINFLNTHRLMHLKELPFKCQYCDKGFILKHNYECHLLTHNLEEELPHECNFCNRRFSNPLHLRRHKFIHTENVSYWVKYKRPKRCTYCLKILNSKVEVKSHKCETTKLPRKLSARGGTIGTSFSYKKRKSDQSWIYTCKACKKSFRYSSSLQKHNCTCKRKFKIQKRLCSVCGKAVYNMNNHMLRHTGERPYQCNKCGRGFFNSTQLRKHSLVHSEVKPFLCSTCGKTFKSLYNLQVHERLHKGNKCHICCICGKGFLEKWYLKKHMIYHEKIS